MCPGRICVRRDGGREKTPRGRSSGSVTVCVTLTHTESPQCSALETLLSGWNAGSGAGEPHGSVGAGVQRGGPGPWSC